MFKRSISLFLCLLFLHSSADARLFLHGTGAGPVFVPAWSTLLGQGGGANSVIHPYSDGSIAASGDSFGAWNYIPGASCILAGRTDVAPCFSVVDTTDSMPGLFTWNSSSGGNNGPVEFVKAPGTLSVGLLWFQNVIYRSTTLTSMPPAWVSTGLSVNYNPNGALKQTAWAAIDPANPDVAYLLTPNGTFGPTDGSSGTLLVNTSFRTCTSSCWSVVAAIPAPSGAGTGCQNDITPCGGNVVFDSTGGTTGGKTKNIYVNVGGQTGVYASTDAGTTWTHITTGSPPHQIYNMTVDSFGQLWAVEGFRNGGATNAYRLASGTWTSWSLSTSKALIAIMQDPASIGGSLGSNHIIVVDNNGQISATLNNGTDNWANTIGIASLSLQSVAPQAGWLNTVNQYATGQLNLNAGTCVNDPAGKIWCGTGIDVFTTPNPITSGALNSTATYSAASVGMNQLVNNLIVAPPGLGTVSANWDRAFITNINPDIPAAIQVPNNVNNCPTCLIIAGGWGLSYAPATPTTLIGTVAGQGGGASFALTTDGANTWTWPTIPSPCQTTALSGVVAANSASAWAFVPSDDTGKANVLQYTTNAMTSCAVASFTGSPSPTNFISPGSCNLACANRQPLWADQVTANKYYLVDLNQNFFVCTGTTLICAPAGATSASIDGIPGGDRLIAVPGNAGHVFYEGESGHVWKSTNSASSFTAICSATSLDNSAMFGFGAPKPGGSGYPSIMAYQVTGGTAAQGYYVSTDAGSTCAALNVSVSERVWAGHVADFPSWITGDPDVYGRWYVGVRGSGPGYYIDTADACPWVKYSNIKPGQTLSGTVTLTATQSGKVPVTSVQFLWDTTNSIGTQTSGTGSPVAYSQSFNVSGLSSGAHTLSLVVAGNGCTETIASIPFTK